ncbi:tyrosine-type recombinase/integrase [Imhoffiella purpurea]|uniref:tyrosine-type recombinase/integrase n=1 Tax=Imhoffiella purpurea TaxID=1249627 RepID=UPI0038B6DC21
MLLYLEQVTPTKRAPERDQWSAKALFPVFTGRQLTEIGAADVRAYINNRRAAGIAPGTINKEVGLMSAATNWAKRELEWEISNPWAARRQTEPAGRDRWLTREEAARLQEAAQTQHRMERYPWLDDFIRLGLNTGMRPGEMLWLEWRRVDLEGAVITFEASGTKTGQKNGKPGKVPLNQEAQKVILARSRFKETHCQGSPWVFCRKDGSRIESIKKGFAACVADAGLVNVHPHDLRRTFGSWLVQAGVGIERVSGLLRHGDVAITARVYAHLRPDDLASAAAVLDRQKPDRKPERTVLYLHTDLHTNANGGLAGKKKPAVAG